MPGRIALSLAVAGTLAAAGCGGSSSPASTAHAKSPASSGTSGASAALDIKNFTFVPGTLTVKPGEKVTVKNEDTAPHTATADDKSFDSKTINGGSTGSFTAPSTPGTYSYICTVHPYMKGKLIVSS